MIKSEVSTVQLERELKKAKHRITDLARSEGECREAESKLRTIFESVSDGIAITNLEGNILQVNRVVMRMHGYESQDELIGRHGSILIAARDQGRTDEIFKRVIEGGDGGNVELTLVKKDGSEFPGEIIFTLLRDDAGNPTGFISLSRDITDRKLAQAALVASETKYSTLVESGNDGIIIIQDTLVKFVNTTMSSMTGYAEAEATGKPFIDFVSPEYRAMVVERYKRRLAGEEVPGRYEIEVMAKDGTKIPVEINASIIEYQGKPADMAIVRDITERKEAESQLKESEDRYRNLFESTYDLIQSVAPDGRLLFVNRPWRETFGYTEAEIPDLNVFDIIHPESFSHCQEMFSKVMKGEPVRDIQTTFVAKDGRSVLLEGSAVPRFIGNKLVATQGFFRDITKRKQLEQELEESRLNLLEAQQIAHVGSWDWQIGPNSLHWSDEMYCIFGLEPEQFRANYEAFINCVHPDDRELVEKSVSSALYENKPHDIEYRVTLPDESERVVRALGKVTFDDTGQPVRMVGTVQDITERKHAEELFKNLAGSSTVGIYIVQDGKFRYVNPQFQRYSGFSEDELLGKDSLDLVFPEDRELVRGNAIRMLKGEITTGYEYRSVNRDGSIQWTLETVAPIQYQGRRATIGNYMDITERKQAEARVRQAAEEWRTTFDSITDAVSIHDKNYRILRVNRAFADMFHMKPQQIIGQHCYEIMHGTDCPWDNCPHQQTLATRKPATIELYEPKVGLYLQASTSPILNERSEVVATVHIARDITERKHQEEQLIMTDRLASVGELVAGIAHELNNPLTSVIGFSALLREAKVPAGVKEDLDIITHEAQRAAGIVKNLLTFARKHETVKQPSQINNIIEEVLKLRAYEQKVSNIAVRRHLARTLPEIPVDYFQMQQVLLNIIVNAETAMLDAHHKGTLTITTRKVNGTVRIILTDDGPGIPKENLDRIFNPFFTTKEVGKGTGLGLSICHGIITAHGGNIYARSKPGSGATFVVELPISGN